jgi:protein-S-isoprenylcysteine O-methyltransferase Ste14
MTQVAGEKEIKLNRSGINALTAPVRWIIITAVVFFITAGRTDIPRVWIYQAFYLAGAIIIGFILTKNVPELLNARGKIQKGTKQWDAVLITTFFMLAIFVTPFIAGQDYRHESNLLPFYWLYPGLVLYILSAVFSVVPMLHNPYFEGMVRIQTDRDQKVVDSGPYRIVRHPGYCGMLCGSLAMPLCFGSILSFIPVSLMIIIILIRTYYEDKTLQKELEGYKEYTRRVKFRIIPFIW